VEKIGETARQVMDTMSEIVWNVNPENDSLTRIVERLKDFGAEILEPLPTQLDFCLDENPAQTALPHAKRYDFYLIFKEAITNAARYAQADIIHVRLERQPDGLQLTIRDDGVGFDGNRLPPTRGSNGLKNMRARAEKIGVALEVVSVLPIARRRQAVQEFMQSWVEMFGGQEMSYA
jgi:signal transduction histidine kinase